MGKKNEIAILPLEDALLFPYMVLPMQVYEEIYLNLIDYAMEGSKKIAITFKRPGLDAEPSPGTICCIGDITYMEEAFLEETEGKAVVISGRERAKIIKCTQVMPFITAKFEPLTDICSSQTEFDHFRDALPQKLIQFMFLKNMPDRDIHLANLIVDPGHIADFIAFYFIDDMYTKMSLLETTDVCERCRKIEELLDTFLKAR